MIISAPSPTLDLQFLLACGGFDPGTLDGVNGPKTQAALAAYRQANPPTTDTNLLGLRARLTTGQKAVLEGFKHLGYTEYPPNSNRTMFGQWYGHDGVKWCAILVSYCFAEGSGYEICKGFSGAGVQPGKGCAYVPTVLAWLKSRGLRVVSPPAPGDIVIFSWDGKTPQHIGMAAGTTMSDGTFPSIEGNTSVSNDSDGGQVLLRPRAMRNVLALGRIP